MRRRAWVEQGVVTLSPDEVADGWLRQALLNLAVRRWGARPWADDVQPAVDLARGGFRVLLKSRDFFEEQEKKLRRGDAEIARLYLPEEKLPAVGSLFTSDGLSTAALFTSVISPLTGE